MKVNALLDSGLHSLFVTKTLADKLKLEGKSQILTLSNAVCSSTKTISKLVNFHIFSQLHPSKKTHFKCMGCGKRRFAKI